MDAIANKVIGGLSSLALEEFGIIWNLKDEKERIENIVIAIKAVLKDAEAKANNHQVSIWLKDLKDVLLDADDLLDDFSTEALRSRLMTGNKMMNKVKIFFSKHNQIAYAFKMGHRIKEIRERLDVIANNRRQLQLTDQPVETPIAYKQRQTYSYVAEDEIIGREEERDLVKDYLFDADVTDHHVSLISIVGIGGLGKTALAQLVYNDKAVQEYFDLTMWVCVSGEFDICKIAQNIIEQAQDSVIEQVQQKLRQKIRGKKYLLVLDDVWSEDGEQWLKLKGLLMEGGKGSKIIVTTRHTVEKIMSPNATLVLEGLDPERSWKLFCRVALDDGEEVHSQELVAIGKDIVRKCGGVPLAIRSVGSLLFTRNLGQADWKYFRDVEFSRTDQHQDKIFSILKLSYDHLPSYLKSCFAYCSLFPKDYTFVQAQLIRLWIAEGFIQRSDEIRCEEDVGHEYFIQLLSRSFFQDVKMDDCGEIGSCKMHDLIHDLAQLVARDEHIVLIEGKEANISKRTRHLSYHVSSVPNCNLSSSLLKRDKIRTCLSPFTSIRIDEQIPGQPIFDFVISLKCLRVLTLYNLDTEEIPKSIKKLKHLRYLRFINFRRLQKFPSEITSLPNLQTLSFVFCNIKELPSNINKLKHLRHLLVTPQYYELECMPRGLGELSCLQTLRPLALGPSSTISTLTLLADLNNLRQLQITRLKLLRDCAPQVEAAKVLLNKQHLQLLQLLWSSAPIEAMEDEEVAHNDEIILEGLQPHHSIKMLSIRGFCGKSLPDWIGNLSSLVTLEICECKFVKSITEGIRNLKSLQNLLIINSPLLEDRCQREIGEDWCKIAHIPYVKINHCKFFHSDSKS